MNGEARGSTLYKRNFIVFRSRNASSRLRGRRLFVAKRKEFSQAKTDGKGSPFGAVPPRFARFPRECPTRPRRLLEDAEGNVASLVRWLRLQKRVYEAKRVSKNCRNGSPKSFVFMAPRLVPRLRPPVSREGGGSCPFGLFAASLARSAS